MKAPARGTLVRRRISPANDIELCVVTPEAETVVIFKISPKTLIKGWEWGDKGKPGCFASLCGYSCHQNKIRLLVFIYCEHPHQRKKKSTSYPPICALKAHLFLQHYSTHLSIECFSFFKPSPLPLLLSIYFPTRLPSSAKSRHSQFLLPDPPFAFSTFVFY